MNTPRDLKFDFTQSPKHWIKQDICTTHMFNTPSLFLPYMEGFVTYAVRAVLDKIHDGKLRQDCLNFIKQEMCHAREHVNYNTMLKNHGYTIPADIKKIKRQLYWLRRVCSPLSLLAIAVGFECFTTFLCKSALENQTLLNADDTMKRFWKWHMMEELEHKSILMDVYIHLGGGYLKRITAFTMVLVVYCHYALSIYRHFLKADTHSQLQGIAHALHKQSFFRKSLILALRCYSYRFHPYQIATNHLLDFNSILIQNEPIT